MRAHEFIAEGGWDSKLTQGTVLHPRIVAPTLQQIDYFVVDFNRWLAAQSLPQIKRGRPTGSSSYHEIDAAERPDTVYGDIDLQMIALDIEGKSPAQFAGYWNQLADQFIKTSGIDYVADESTPGHPIVQIGPDQYVQIDFMWHPESTSQWGAARVTPERGIKGMLMGNMFSVFGELLDLSIQHAGVQLKVVDGKHVPFSKQKGTQIVTVTINPETFILDTFKYIAAQDGVENPAISPLLAKFPGNNVNDVRIATLVQGVKGFAESAEQNNMFGQGELANYSSAEDFLAKFLERYIQKAMADVEGKKRDKAATPEAQARAEQDRAKILQGLELVKGMFAQESTQLDELVEPEEREVASPEPFTAKQVQYRKNTFGNADSGAYAYGEPDPEDPHMFNKQLYGPSVLQDDAYYQYIKAAKPYMGENPYFPRVYIVKLEKDEAGLIRPVYKMEALRSGKELDLTKRGQEILYYMFKKTFGEAPPSWRTSWYEISDALGLFLRRRDEFKNADPLLKQAADLISKVKNSNGNFDYDVHTGNIMIRLTSLGPQLVITDPLYEMNFNSMVFDRN